jgi:hypothetical protein
MPNALLPAPTVDAEVRGYLDALTRERILEPAENAGVELPEFGLSVLPTRQTIVRTKEGAWLFVDSRNDPTAQEYGGRIPVPAIQQQRLAALSRAGVRPDHVWLAHELPAGWDGMHLPQLVPAPVRLREHDGALLDKVRGFLSGVGEAAVGFGALVAEGLDPIVLGGVQHPTVSVVNWVVLAQWTWD